MKKLLLFFISALFFLKTSAQNFSVMMIEDFEDGTPANFNLDSVTGFGTNKWIINNAYSGFGIFPETPTQDSTEGGIGQIGYAGGNYMHIKDFANSVQNASYNPLNPSQRWAKLDTGFCTFGFSKVVLNFWWVAKGSPGDYGEVYYSVDGGTSWILTANDMSGFTKYNGKTKWNFARVEDPAFINVPDLRFAFKWNNDAVNTGDSLPFSVDDVMIVAEYEDYDANSIEAVNFVSSPICHEDYDSPEFWFTVNDSVCDGVYVIEMSDSSGSFVNSTFLWDYAFTLGSFIPPATFALPSSWGVKFPTSMPAGNCYSFRVVRLTPPVIVGSAYTVCIEIIDCEDSITIAKPPAVTQDPYYDSLNTANMPGLPAGQQPVCIRSVIDVNFYSFGAYNPGNQYWLQLSDSSGSFDNDTNIIGGPTSSTQTFDPALYPPPISPGGIGGQIPVTPEGCNYYLRVISSNPVVDNTAPTPQYSVPWGPFCIKECDILTNDAIDISVCITDSDSACVTIPIDINTWDSIQSYNPGNEFIVQLLSPGDPPMNPPAMTIVNEGDLGISVNTVSGMLEVCVPKLPDYLALGLKLQMYYMRIVATDGVDTTDVLGSLIHLTVGGVTGSPVIFEVQPDTIVCDTVDFLNITVYTPSIPLPTSVFIVQITGFLPIEWDPAVFGWPSLTFSADNLPSGTYIVTIQEKQKGGDCIGPISMPDTFTINFSPEVNIYGPQEVCVGDTAVYTVDFSGATYYNWDFSGAGIGTVIVFGNNEITVVWDNTGSASLKLQACNKCDNEVIYCDAKEITINVNPYAVLAVSSDITICEGDSLQLTAINTTLDVDNYYSWWLSNGDTIQTSMVEKGGDTLSISPGSSTVYFVEADNGCPGFDTVTVNVFKKHIVNTNGAAICIGDSAQLIAYAEEASSYLWTPAAGLNNDTINNPMAKPVVSTDYIVRVSYDSICPQAFDTINVTVNIPVVNTGNDTTIYLGDKVFLNASGGVNYLWSPTTGLDNPNTANPLASPDSTTTYFVTITDANGCVAVDSITIEIKPNNFKPEVPDAFTPDGKGPFYNDKLYVFDVLGREGDAVESINFKIFNRWGELIFEATERSQIIYPNGGWDGTNMNNGKKMEVGVYVWLLEAQTVKGIKIGPVSGNVTLIR